MAGKPDPKPRKRKVASSPDYQSLVRRLLLCYPTCELCGEKRSESAHHVIPRGQSGDDVWENLIALCGDGVKGCHGGVEHSVEVRSKLRSLLRFEVVLYANERDSFYFNQHYPSSPV